MPVVSRKQLRQNLGRNWLRDTHVGTTTASWQGAPGSIQIVDYRLADLSLSGQGAYARSWLVCSGGEAILIATYNAGTGALLSQANGFGFNVPASGAEYERHDLVDPLEKNRAIDESVQRLRVRQEVAFNPDGSSAVYPLGTLPIADPERDVLDCYYLADVANRDRRSFTWWGIANTATGYELRIDPALGGSVQIALDAVVCLTLGAAEAATVNIPSERLVLAGAAARCYDLLAKRAPGTVAGTYTQRRDECARIYSQLAADHKPKTARAYGFADSPPRRFGWGP
jgi:hypothetical protein